MMQQCDVVAHHDGAEAVAGEASDQNPVAGLKVQIGGCENVDGVIAVLDEQRFFIITKIDDRGLKSDGGGQAGFGVGELMDRGERGEGSGGCGRCAGRAAKNKRSNNDPCSRRAAQAPERRSWRETHDCTIGRRARQR
jgi:hypothetical protein